MVNQLTSYCSSQNLFKAKDPILLAVSGGVDSTVLAHHFKKAGYNFGIAHINFRLRGKDSDTDASFVKKLSESFGVPFFIAGFDTNEYASDRKISIQMAARELRYQWLEQIRKEHGFHFIATAHHQDDVIETVLLNMFRGTGIHGLHGIRPKHGKIIRPMLGFYKNEIIAYAKAQNIDFREDASNLKTDYDRNKIRLEIIPAIEKNYPGFSATFSENISRWDDAGDLYDEQIRLLKKKLVVEKQEETVISIPKLRLLTASKTVLYELLKEYDFSSDQSLDVHASFNSLSGKMFYSATHQVLKDRNQLIITKINKESSSSMLINSTDRNVQHELLHLKIALHDAMSFEIPSDASVSCLNYELLQFPLLLRKWEKGDYFYPLGMKKKKKKISDYLIDKKMPLHKKEQVWVIQSGERIACIIGERIDERFKVEAATKKVFVIKMN
ncbi:MAG: tRNA lysidine(34) synthetase TilS [Chitinophagales bacterium]